VEVDADDRAGAHDPAPARVLFGQRKQGDSQQRGPAERGKHVVPRPSGDQGVARQHERQRRARGNRRGDPQTPRQPVEGEIPRHQVQRGKYVDRGDLVAQAVGCQGIRKIGERVGQGVGAHLGQRGAQELMGVPGGKAPGHGRPASVKHAGKELREIVVLHEVVGLVRLGDDAANDQHGQPGQHPGDGASGPARWDRPRCRDERSTATGRHHGVQGPARDRAPREARPRRQHAREEEPERDEHRMGQCPAQQPEVARVVQQPLERRHERTGPVGIHAQAAKLDSFVDGQLRIPRPRWPLRGPRVDLDRAVVFANRDGNRVDLLHRLGRDRQHERGDPSLAHLPDQVPVEGVAAARRGKVAAAELPAQLEVVDAGRLVRRDRHDDRQGHPAVAQIEMHQRQKQPAAHDQADRENLPEGTGPNRLGRVGGQCNPPSSAARQRSGRLVHTASIA